ncbi:MAG: hypothetical protein EOO77_07985 [Oxalobacteraceae bacterium]|nr:MAG: hypothetical protein EOO77_07985 [Oxalobacteraceae bacterium]
MNGAEAYASWAAGEHAPSIWHAQSAALTLMYNAIDRELLSSTQWNYTVSNANDPMIGDGWNQEDLSIWSADQATNPNDPNSGGRGIEGFCRPYVRKAQGTIISQRFDRDSGTFDVQIDVDSGIDASTEIYIPNIQYRNGYNHDVADSGTVEASEQTLAILAKTSGPLSIRLTRR